jgi:heparosan-N-sulfate-glucuronate 5-epimerase
VIPYRLFDGRSEHLGPYYVTMGDGLRSGKLDRDGILRSEGLREPLSILQFGLEQHASWVRRGDEQARRRFLTQAEWAASAQFETSSLRGLYKFPSIWTPYGRVADVRSATAQGQAISLLLRAYEDTGREFYLERAVDAATPLTVDVREGGVLWQNGDDFFLEGIVGTLPSHVLSEWICALWGLFELSRTSKGAHLQQLYSKSLATLEKYLPCYDSGSWSYENLLAAPTGFRRFAPLRLHMFHVAQLSVLLSMTQNEMFSVVAERWRGYITSVNSHLRVWANALPGLFLSDILTVPGGARCVV